MAEAVDAVCPAIEIIDDRHADYRNLEVLSVIADNAWNAGIVLGDFVRSWPDLASIEGIVSVNGEKTDRGFGRDVLGHPFHPVAWLASHLAPKRNAVARRRYRDDRKPGDHQVSGAPVHLSASS